MLAFLQIKNSSNPQIIGTTNGVYQVEVDQSALLEHENYNEIDRVFFSPFKDVVQFNNLALKVTCQPIQARLSKKAVITDLMGFSPYFLGCSFIISQKFLECLREFGVNDNQFNVLPINIRGADISMYILYVSMIPLELIDFRESLLIDASNPYSKGVATIESYQEFRNGQESGVFFEFQKICIPEKFQRESILNLQAESNLFFSEELVRFLLTKDISGFEILKRQTELIFN